MNDPLPPGPVLAASRPWRPALFVVGYFVVFFAAMGLGGVLFLLGGFALILAPGSLPLWADISYVASGIIGSVTIALLVANRAFRIAARREHSPRRAPATSVPEAPTEDSTRRSPGLLAWVAGIGGTVIASVLSAVLGAVVLNMLDRQ